MAERKDKQSEDSLIRDHTYDGIQEYDKKLPNWWLFTLYGAILFAFGYWFYYYKSGWGKSERQVVTEQMAAIHRAQEASLQKSSGGDAQFWAMAKDKSVVAKGKSVFMTTCVSCHKDDLKGVDDVPPGIGADLADTKWTYGGKPTEIKHTIEKGTQKGMPGWGPILGDQKVNEVVAYILSRHHADSDLVAR